MSKGKCYKMYIINEQRGVKLNEINIVCSEYVHKYTVWSVILNVNNEKLVFLIDCFIKL